MLVRRDLELYHHGIKGQRWGVRNGPPYPLGSDVSNGDRLIAQKRVQSFVNKSYTDFDQATTDVAQKLSKNVRKEDIDRLLKLKNEWHNVSQNTEDFYDSKECEEANEKAYQAVIEWFNKYQPGQIESWRKIDDDLESFHDFRKMLEGYEDEYYDEYLKKFEQRLNKQGKKSENWYFEQYTNAVKKYVDDLIGTVSYSLMAPKTGANRVVKFSKKGKYEAFANNATVHDIVYWAIDELEKNRGIYFSSDGSVRLK